ncbi:ArnT family glycosyltransferase [Pontibacter liquoris]|uniref:ArnT family glycosyltransferase n=1 Tax=Pontibacter liquoris TaxID=2905677 RepID=UPI001FA6CA45|nr:phospholipid carrier-dependent glycosyltransferase [Pontibacter liquoris]
MFKLESRYSGRTVLFLLLLLLALLLYNLGGWGVIETSEARYAEISREMLASSDWLHPRLLGILHYHKPPATYVISAWGMGIFGMNEFGARFFLQLSLVLQAGLVYLLGLELFKSRRTALIAMVVYITIPAVLLAARNLTTDSFLTTFELLAIYAWLKYKPRQQAAWIYLFYTCLALAFLTKGPVGLIFPVLLAIGYRPATETSLPQPIRWGHHLPALLLFLVLGLSWYLYLMQYDPRFIDYFIFKHTVERYANPETFGRAKPWWFYLVLAPVLSLPWAAILLLNLKKLRNLPRLHKRLFILWLLVPLVFFSLSSSKLILYILPLFAGQALLTGWLLQALPQPALRKATLGALLYFGVLALALLAGPLLPFGVAVPGWALVFPVMMLVGLLLLWRRKNEYLLQLLGGALVFCLLLIPYSTHVMGANPELINSSSHLTAALQQEPLRGKQVLVYDKLLPSLAFELGHNFITIHDQDHNLNRETQFEQSQVWREKLLQLDRPDDVQRLKQLLQQNTALLVKGDLPEKSQWIKRYLPHYQQVGKWKIYY